MHVWMNLDHACAVSWTTAALVPDRMDELQMRTSPLLAYFGQYCENRQGCTLMAAPPDDTVYPTKAWPHLLFELWHGSFIHISDENFLSKLASSSTVPLQMLPVCYPCWSPSIQNLGNLRHAWFICPLVCSEISVHQQGSKSNFEKAKALRHCLCIRQEHILAQHFTVLAGNNAVSWAAVLGADACASAFLGISQTQSEHSKLCFTPRLLSRQPSEPEQDWTWGWSSDLEIVA